MRSQRSGAERLLLSELVLDSSAVPALVNGEPGADVVAAALPGAAISAVNLSEVVAKLVEAGFPEAGIQDMLGLLSMAVAPFGADQAFLAGFFRSATQGLGLPLGDRAYLALAHQRNGPVLTTDRVWQHGLLSVDVQLIR